MTPPPAPAPTARDVFDLDILALIAKARYTNEGAMARVVLGVVDRLERALSPRPDLAATPCDCCGSLTGCDCWHRAKCDKAGAVGHFDCGWCVEHRRPRFMCPGACKTASCPPAPVGGGVVEVAK